MFVQLNDTLWVRSSLIAAIEEIRVCGRHDEFNMYVSLGKRLRNKRKLSVDAKYQDNVKEALDL